MKEELLHHVWKYSLFTNQNLRLTTGETLQIIHAGTHNTDAGPDFFNAKIKIDETIWAGNVEIHINSSDWYNHKHHKDKAYQNVILHVVFNHDKTVLYSNKSAIPTLEIHGSIDTKIINNFSNLIQSKSWIPCKNQLFMIDEFTISSWKNRLAVERLERKAFEIEESLEQNKNNWEETFYHYLFKYFGLNVNAQPFFQLAKNTPLKIIEKHHNTATVEALLYGQAGFLNEEVEDSYYQELQEEYNFLQSKFSLQPIDKSMWKFLRLRPPNFPTIRLSQLTDLLIKHPRIFSQIIELNDTKEICKLFEVKASVYWKNHYNFGKWVKQTRVKKIGKTTIDNLIINVVVPFTFVYGKSINNEQLTDKALNLLEQLSSENNSIIKNWKKLGVHSGNALHSQSLIELKNNYCSKKKCLHCVIGNKILQL